MAKFQDSLVSFSLAIIQCLALYGAKFGIDQLAMIFSQKKEMQTKVGDGVTNFQFNF